MADESDVVLSVRDLRVYINSSRGTGKAVDGVSFDLRRGETLGLVGESGSGKSLTSLALVGLLPAPVAWIAGGQVLFEGEDLVPKTQAELRSYRGRHIAMVLQDPLSALNPSFTIKSQLSEPLRLHRGLRGPDLEERAGELLELMQIPAARERLNSYPHEFSGGMRQRVVGAIGIAGGPEVLIADEPTTALDVTAQAAYLELLKSLQRETNLAMLFITHDLGIVGDICHRVAVMYAGRVVETASKVEIFDAPAHPYTRALLRSVPDMAAPRTDRLVSIGGSPPTVYSHPTGCAFHNRCWLFNQLDGPERCKAEVPELVESSTGRQVACHFPEEAVTRTVDGHVGQESKATS